MYKRAGGMPELVLEYVLKQRGIVPGQDMEIINNIAFSSTSGAFIGGVGDYSVEFEPVATTLEQQGNGYVVASLGKLNSNKVLPIFYKICYTDFIKYRRENYEKF